MTRNTKQEAAAPFIRSTAQEVDAASVSADTAMHREMAARAASIPDLSNMTKLTRDMTREEIIAKVMGMGKP